MDWLVWPAGQFINFFFIPTQFRVVFVNIILFCWNVFLSYAKFNVREEVLFIYHLVNVMGNMFKNALIISDDFR